MGLKPQNSRQWLGVVLLILSSLAYMALPVIPFLELSLAQKSQWAGTLYLFSAVTWWACLPLLGKEFMQWFRRYGAVLLQRAKAMLGR